MKNSSLAKASPIADSAQTALVSTSGVGDPSLHVASPDMASKFADPPHRSNFLRDLRPASTSQRTPPASCRAQSSHPALAIRDGCSKAADRPHRSFAEPDENVAERDVPIHCPAIGFQRDLAGLRYQLIAGMTSCAKRSMLDRS